MKTTLEAEPKRDPRKIHETLWKAYTIYFLGA